MLLVEINIKSIHGHDVLARVQSEDWHELVGYLKKKGYHCHPLVLSRIDDEWTAEVYEKPNEL